MSVQEFSVYTVGHVLTLTVLITVTNVTAAGKDNFVTKVKLLQLASITFWINIIFYILKKRKASRN